MRIFMDELLFSQPTLCFVRFRCMFVHCLMHFVVVYPFSPVLPSNLLPFIESVPLPVAKSIFELLGSFSFSVSLFVCSPSSLLLGILSLLHH